MELSFRHCYGHLCGDKGGLVGGGDTRMEEGAKGTFLAGTGSGAILRRVVHNITKSLSGMPVAVSRA